MQFSLAFDQMSKEELEAHILNWTQERSAFSYPQENLEAYFNSVTPRSVFVKTLKENTTLLDLGAGAGSLSIYKTWPDLARSDLKLYGISLGQGEFFDRYDGIWIGDFEKSEPQFDVANFDAINCAHFIEHMHEIAPTIDFAKRRLNQRGRLYLEWPHPVSERAPSCDVIGRVTIEPFATNFYDDKTHIKAWPYEEVFAELEGAGFAIESYGRAHFPGLAAAMRDQARETSNKVTMTLAIWAHLGWAQYLVARKIGG